MILNPGNYPMCTELLKSKDVEGAFKSYGAEQRVAIMNELIQAASEINSIVQRLSSVR